MNCKTPAAGGALKRPTRRMAQAEVHSLKTKERKTAERAKRMAKVVRAIKKVRRIRVEKMTRKSTKTMTASKGTAAPAWMADSKLSIKLASIQIPLKRSAHNSALLTKAALPSSMKTKKTDTLAANYFKRRNCLKMERLPLDNRATSNITLRAIVPNISICKTVLGVKH